MHWEDEHDPDKPRFRWDWRDNIVVALAAIGLILALVAIHSLHD